VAVIWLVPSYYAFVFFVVSEQMFNHEEHEGHEGVSSVTQPEFPAGKNISPPTFAGATQPRIPGFYFFVLFVVEPLFVPHAEHEAREEKSERAHPQGALR
jgi:hypothetical protein